MGRKWEIFSSSWRRQIHSRAAHAPAGRRQPELRDHILNSAVPLPNVWTTYVPHLMDTPRPSIYAVASVLLGFWRCIPTWRNVPLHRYRARSVKCCSACFQGAGIFWAEGSIYTTQSNNIKATIFIIIHILHTVCICGLRHFSCLFLVSEPGLFSLRKREALTWHCKMSVKYLGLKQHHLKPWHGPFANRVFFKILPLITWSDAATAPGRQTIFSGEKSNLFAIN